MDRIPRISPADARLLEGEQFVDVRNPQAWAESDVKIPGAVRVPLDAPDAELMTLPKERTIVTYCT